MNHIRIRNKTVIFYLEDSRDMTDQSKILDDVIEMLESGVDEFIFDFQSVCLGFSSNLVGLVMGIIKNLGVLNKKVIFRGLQPAGVEVLKLANVDQVYPGIVING